MSRAQARLIAESIVDAIDIRRALEFYGIKFNRRGYAICPFHTEKTASLYIKGKRFKCFGCGVGGNIIDFVRWYHKLNFTDATIKIDNDFHLGIVCRKTDYRSQLQAVENSRIIVAECKMKEDIHSEYLSVCEVRSILYGRFLSGEAWLEDIIRRLDILLDDFTGKEARAWEMAIRPQKST